MRNFAPMIVIASCLGLGLTACEPSDASTPTLSMTTQPQAEQRTMSPEGMLCGIPIEFWRSVYGEAQLGEDILDAESSRPDPTPYQQTQHYDCILFNGETGKYYSYSTEKLVRISIEKTNSVSRDELLYVKENITNAPPEMQFIARDSSGWLYPGKGLLTSALLQANAASEDHGVLGWTCGNTYVVIHVYPSLLASNVAEVASGSFNHIVEGVNCSSS